MTQAWRRSRQAARLRSAARPREQRRDVGRAGSSVAGVCRRRRGLELAPPGQLARGRRQVEHVVVGAVGSRAGRQRSAGVEMERERRAVRRRPASPPPAIAPRRSRGSAPAPRPRHRPLEHPVEECEHLASDVEAQLTRGVVRADVGDTRRGPMARGRARRRAPGGSRPPRESRRRRTSRPANGRQRQSRGSRRRPRSEHGPGAAQRWRSGCGRSARRRGRRAPRSGPGDRRRPRADRARPGAPQPADRKPAPVEHRDACGPSLPEPGGRAEGEVAAVQKQNRAATARRAGWPRAARSKAAVPPYEMPTAATRPSDQGRETIQSSTASASPASSGGHSSGRAPNDAPAPRTSMSTTE